MREKILQRESERALEGSSEEELDRRHPLLDGVGRQFPVADQVQLELADVFRPELIGRAFEIGGKLLARYTHRVAISNHRLVSFAEGKVTFRWKDYAHGNKSRLMTLAAEEFLRRFLLHVLPRGFVRVRFFGLLANRRRSALLPLCRRLIEEHSASLAPSPVVTQDSSSSGSTCPLCGGPMMVLERLTPQQLLTELTRRVAIADTS